MPSKNSEACIGRISDAMGGATLDEQIAMANEADRIVKDSVGLSEDEIFARLDADILDRSIAKKIEGRNKALNSIARRNTEQFVRSFDGDPALGFESLLVGINDVKMGSRRSVAGTQAQLQESYMAGLVADIEDLGKNAFDAFTSGELDQDIARALWKIDKGDDFSGISKDALSIGKVINKWQEKTRIDANEAGAYIKKLPGYITRQSHDMDKIRNAGFAQWRETIEPLLDERTFIGVDDREAFLSSVHSGLSTGLHFGNGTVPGLKGTKNIAKSASQERVLHFREAEGWFQYNERFGRGPLVDTIMNGLRISAQNTGLMKILGPNAEGNYDRVMDSFLRELKNTDNQAAIDLEKARKGKLDNFIKQTTGETNIPASHVGATVGQSVRAFQSLTKLGGAVLSSIADVPISAMEMRYQGKGMLDAYSGALKNAAGALGDMGKSIVNRQLTVKDKNARRVLAELGVSLDSTTGLFTSRFDPSGEAIPGRVSNAVRTFFRLNGLTLWTDSMRAGSTIGMAQHVGDLSTRSFKKLPDGLQDTFTLFGIGDAQWDLIRSVGARKFDGVDGKFLVPESIDDIDEGLLKSHLSSINVKPTKFQIKKLRADLKDSLRTYYVDRSQYAVIEPDAKVRATMLRDSQPGTVAGEMLRTLAQFKAFPFSLVQKVWGREVRGRRTRGSSIAGMSELMVGSMIFGYIAMSAKDIAKNKEPRDPTNPTTMVAAFLQGGAAGIYGDFLFGQGVNRFGGGLVSTLAGPSAGTADQIAKIYSKALEGNPDVGKDLFRLLYQAAPAAASLAYPGASALNAVYSKAVLDNLIYYNVMESLSPGYKRRMERRLKKQNDQEVLIR
ncbi:MAG: hypothetical protein V3U78_04605 [Thiotrichaceae bacterium]